MSAGDVLAVIVAHLDAAGVPHMLAGSMASSFHGEPRSTQDIDLVIDPDQSSPTPGGSAAPFGPTGLH